MRTINFYKAVNRLKKDTAETYAERLYNKNKQRINSVMIMEQPKQAFIQEFVFEATNKYDNDFAKTAQKLLRSEVFTPKAERYARNLIKAMQKDPSYDVVLKATGDTVMDITQVKYMGDGVYTYKNCYIMISNSPAQISVVVGDEDA